MSVIIPDPVATKWVPLGPQVSIPLSAGYVRVLRSANFACANNGYTPIQWDGVSYDPSGMWSAGTPDRLTVKIAGTYIIMGSYEMANVAGGYHRFCTVDVNGSVVIGEGGNAGPAYTAGGAPRLGYATAYRLSVGDYVRLNAYQDSGAALNMFSGNMNMILVGGPTGPKGDPGILVGMALSSTPPVGPVDGQLWYFPAGSNGEIWTFRYNAGSASAFKWEFVGGASLIQGPSGQINQTAVSTYQDLTSGPVITVPRAGLYQLEHNSYFQSGGAGQGGLTINTRVLASTTGGLLVASLAGTSGYFSAPLIQFGYVTLAAGETLKIQTQQNANAAGALYSGQIRLNPVRVA